ncbi:hypothetical protein C8J57DRAFT_1482851 [Mycena rebaudengoi]|nr:hypothetical protein C8J57DRAFT_1482851 [Mycena rebaudengoi]
MTTTSFREGPALRSSGLLLLSHSGLQRDPDQWMSTAEVKHYKRSYTFKFLLTPPTTTRSSETGSIYAPVRRLPTEILVHIFSLHSDTFTPAFKTPFPTRLQYEFEAELDRLANIHLLTLSRVCGQWHRIVMDTPALWSTFSLNGVLWSSPYRLEKAMTLLGAGLARTGTAPIEVRIFDDMGARPLAPLVFELLAKHSHCWRTAEFCCSIEGIDLSVLKGKLHILQRLEIDIWNMRPGHTAINFFDSASRLDTLIVPGSLLGKIGAIPFNQLTGLECDRVEPEDIPRAISFASELRPGSRFHLSADVAGANQHFPVRSPPRTSPISRFSCRLMGDFYVRHSRRGLGGIFASLSLPNLEELQLLSDQYPKVVAEWPHAQFLALSARSGFHRSLKVLRIAEVLITDEDLIAVLYSLDLLEHLEVADKQHTDATDIDLVLVTDTFLHALTLHGPDANPRLVPQLRRFACATQLQFADHVFGAFVESRLNGSSCAFRIEIRSLAGREGTSYCASLSTLLHDLRMHNGSRLEYDLGGGPLPLA